MKKDFDAHALGYLKLDSDKAIEAWFISLRNSDPENLEFERIWQKTSDSVAVLYIDNYQRLSKNDYRRRKEKIIQFLIEFDNGKGIFVPYDI